MNGHRLGPILLCLAVGLGARPAGTAPSVPQEPDVAPGLEAPVVAIDRFSDAAGHRLRRSSVPGLPGPNKPIRLDDAPFRVDVTTPDGRTRTCYDLDLQPPVPGRMYVFYDPQGNYVIDQFPVIDAIPGDPGYSDVWIGWRVTMPLGRQSNSIRDAATVKKLLADPKSGFSAQSTAVLLNHPVVPDGSTAGMRADGKGGHAVLRYAWYRGRRAAFLHFEGSIQGTSDRPPVSVMTVKSAAPPLAAVAAKAAPGAPGYSPLHRLVDPSGKDLAETPLNCPIVGP